MIRLWLLLLGLLPAMLGAMPARADDLTALFQTPGVHAILRHALAPGTGDPTAFDVTDCKTQRNLDERGRQQARAIGEALRANGARFDMVLTSQWCRCRETAELLDMGAPVEAPMLNSFFEDRSTAEAQTRDLSEHLASQPPGKRILYVTHQVNITALTGRGVGSGELFLIRARPGGGAEVIGSLDIGW